MAAPQRFEVLTGWSFPLNGYQDDPAVYAALRVGLESQPLLLISVVLMLLGTIVVAGRWLRRRAKPSNLWIGSIGCAIVFVITPYARAYDLTLLLWPILYLVFTRELSASWLRRGVAAIVYLAPILLLVLNAPGVWNVLAVLMLLIVLLATRTQTV